MDVNTHQNEGLSRFGTAFPVHKLPVDLQNSVLKAIFKQSSPAFIARIRDIPRMREVFFELRPIDLERIGVPGDMNSSTESPLLATLKEVALNENGTLTAFAQKLLARSEYSTFRDLKSLRTSPIIEVQDAAYLNHNMGMIAPKRPVSGERRDATSTSNLAAYFFTQQPTLNEALRRNLVDPGSLDATLARIASAPTTSPQQLAELALRNIWLVRACVAENVKTPVQVFQRYASDESLPLLGILIRNPAFPDYLLNGLARHPIADIRGQVADSSRASAATLVSLSQDDDATVRVKAVRNNRYPSAGMVSLASGCDHRIQSTIARHPHIPAAALKPLIASRNVEIYLNELLNNPAVRSMMRSLHLNANTFSTQ